MKLKVIQRVEEEHTRATKMDRFKVQRNLDPLLHPMERGREYSRALNAVKLERLFAKPFIGALDGHVDSVLCIAASPDHPKHLTSGAADGEVRVWDLSAQSTVYRAIAHSTFVNDVVVLPDVGKFLSCGEDGFVKCWPLTIAPKTTEGGEPLAEATWSEKLGFKSIDVLRETKGGDNAACFATGGHGVQLWSFNRAEPVCRYNWDSATTTCVRFNPAEKTLLAGCGTDRSVCVYDTRAGGGAARKTILRMRSNDISWNPREPLNFVVASDDHNVYSFDMRKLNRALMVHKDHIGPVNTVHFSPTGKEFVTGSHDRTARLFCHREGRSRDVYHTKRMQRVNCVRYSADARFVISGSDDMCLRIWRTKASEQLGPKLPREQRHREYQESLKKQFGALPEVKRISRHRLVPHYIKKATEAERLQRDKKRRKQANVERHSKPGTLVKELEREKHIVKEME